MAETLFCKNCKTMHANGGTCPARDDDTPSDWNCTDYLEMSGTAKTADTGELTLELDSEFEEYKPTPEETVTVIPSTPVPMETKPDPAHYTPEDKPAGEPIKKKSNRGRKPRADNTKETPAPATPVVQEAVPQETEATTTEITAEPSDELIIKVMDTMIKLVQAVENLEKNLTEKMDKLGKTPKLVLTVTPSTED